MLAMSFLHGREYTRARHRQTPCDAAFGGGMRYDFSTIALMMIRFPPVVR